MNYEISARSTDRNGRAPCADVGSQSGLDSAEHHREVVGGHLSDFDQRKTRAIRQRRHSLYVAHAPCGIPLAQALVEGVVAIGSMPAAALERTIKKKRSAPPQGAARAGDKSLGNIPWCNVDDIGAENSEQFVGPAVVSHRV